MGKEKESLKLSLSRPAILRVTRVQSPQVWAVGGGTRVQSPPELGDLGGKVYC